MIRKNFNPKPYIPPSRFPDNRPVSKEIIKSDDTNLNAAMVAAINTSNPSEILNFFQTKLGANYVDKDKNTPLHFIVMIDENKLNQKQKIYLISKLLVEPFNIQIDTPNQRGETPLHLAVTKQQHKVIEYFLINGADATKINANHQNAFHLAMIPNIQPCEKKATPDPIVNVENSVEDKNTIYNEALSVFYNNRDTFNPVIEIIKYHASKVEDYFEDYHQTQIGLSGSDIVISDTQVEKSLKDIQNTFVSKIVGSTYTKSDIKKNINYQTIKSVQKISSEYEKFIKSSLTEINLENRDLLDLSETDLNKIVLNMLSNSKTSVDDIGKQLTEAKNSVLNKIYDQIDSVLRILNPNYTWSRKNIPGQMNPLNYAPVYNPGAAPFALVPGGPGVVNDTGVFVGLFNRNNYYLVRNTREAYEQHILQQIGAFHGVNPIPDPLQDRVKRGITNTLFLKNTNPTTDDNLCLNIFIYLYGSNLYSDVPDDDIRDKIIQYYNMLLDGIGNLMKYNTFGPTLPIPVPGHPAPPGHIAPAVAGVLLNINQFSNINQTHRTVVAELNKSLPEHINTLNMWLALDNIRIRLISSYYNFVPSQTIPNFEFYNSVRTPKLNNFLLVENLAGNYDAKSKYGIISDQRGNIDNAGVPVVIVGSALSESAIPMGFNAENTNVITQEWAAGANTVQTNINARLVAPLQPYTSATQKIINSLTKIGVFDGAVFGGNRITSQMIDNMIHHISTQIMAQNVAGPNPGFAVGPAPVPGAFVPLANNPTPYVIADTQALWALIQVANVVGLNNIYDDIINVMAGQDLIGAIAVGPPNAFDPLLNKIKSRLIMAIVEGYVKDRSPIKILPRRMNKTMHCFNDSLIGAIAAGAANAAIIPNLPAPPAAAPIPPLNVQYALSNIDVNVGNGAIVAQDINETARNTINAIKLLTAAAVLGGAPAGPLFNIRNNDNSINEFANNAVLISVLRQNPPAAPLPHLPLPANIFIALNDGVNPPLPNSPKETEICQKVIRAVMLGYMTKVPDPDNLNSLSQIISVPNSFGMDVAGIDYMNYMKKRFIMWFIQRINLPGGPPAILVAHPNDEVNFAPAGGPPPPPPVLHQAPILNLTNIYTSIESIVRSHFGGLEDLGPDNLRLKTISIIVKILDRLFINTVKAELYLQSVNRLKSLILTDGTPAYSSFRNRVVKFLNQILHKSNVPIKLDKKIDQMILITPDFVLPNAPNLPNPLPIHQQYLPSPNHQQIIDEDRITKIFDYGRDPINPAIIRDEPTQIYRKDNLGDYIVHYPMDYNSLQQISVRQCLYNTTSVINTLFTRAKQVDYFKPDINKFSPIFYAIQSKNYLLIKEFIDLVRGGPLVGPGGVPIPIPPNFSYPIQQQLNGHNQSAVAYALNLVADAQIVPEFDMLNVTFINNLLLLADIGRNLPRGFYDMYQYLLYDLENFFIDPNVYNFRGLIQYNPALPLNPSNPADSMPGNFTVGLVGLAGFFAANTQKNKLHYKAPLMQNILNQKSTYELIQELDQTILANKTISVNMAQIVQDKNTAKVGEWGMNNVAVPPVAIAFPGVGAVPPTHTLAQHIAHLKNIVTIFESRYKPNRLYDYIDIDPNPPNNPIRSYRPNRSNRAFFDSRIKSTNRFFLILISMGIISIRDLILDYYLNIVLSTLNTTNIYNFSNNVFNDMIAVQTKAIIDTYTRDNIFDMVRMNYLIKLDQYDNINQSQNVVEDFFSKLLDQLSQNGVIQPESQTYNNIKQYINGHMIELVSKTLQYTQVILDVFHRWIVNLYHILRTYDEITN
jgi:hypothetical protein